MAIMAGALYALLFALAWIKRSEADAACLRAIGIANDDSAALAIWAARYSDGGLHNAINPTEPIVPGHLYIRAG